MLLAALAVACPPVAAIAQEPGSGKSGFFGRGFGGGGDARESGAYVSPSAIPDAAPGDIGINLSKPLQKFEPIALPDLQRNDLGSARLDLPSLPAYAPQNRPTIDLLKGRRTLHLDARLVKDGDIVPTGLVWRLFAPEPGADGKLPLLASAKGGGADFDVPAGAYLMHVGFGRAGVTQRIDFSGQTLREEIVLDAGGLKLNAVAPGNVAIPADKLSFDVYSDAPEERDRQLVAEDIKPNTVVPFNAGTYHVVSRYGGDNAEVRGDVKVEAGRIVDVTLQHRAAQLTMKLVREKGGEAIADTAWQVMNASGETIRESVGAFPSMVLAEGEYVVVAKNREKTYQRDFDVAAGVNADVELMTTDILPAPDSAEGSGD